MNFLLALLFGLFTIFGKGLQAVTNLDIQAPVDRYMRITGYGFALGFPFSSATSNSTTGVPTNGKAGWAPSAIFINVKATSLGTFLYVNTGSNTSSTWTNLV